MVFFLSKPPAGHGRPAFFQNVISMSPSAPLARNVGPVLLARTPNMVWGRGERERESGHLYLLTPKGEGKEKLASSVRGRAYTPV